MSAAHPYKYNASAVAPIAQEEASASASAIVSKLLVYVLVFIYSSLVVNIKLKTVTVPRVYQIEFETQEKTRTARCELPTILNRLRARRRYLILTFASFSFFDS